MAGFTFYNGPIGPQSVGWIILDALTADMLIGLVNDGPEGTGTTLGILAAFLSSGPAETSLQATGTNHATALQLPGQVCIFTNVAAGTGAAIPDTAPIGSRWDVWNAGTHDLTLWPMDGTQIEAFGIGNPATVPVGGRATFAVNSATQVYVR